MTGCRTSRNPSDAARSKANVAEAVPAPHEQACVIGIAAAGDMLATAIAATLARRMSR